MRLNEFVEIANLPLRGIPSNMKVTVSGWGQLGIKNIFPQYLQKLEVIALSIEDCREYDRDGPNDYRNDMFCTYSEELYRGLDEASLLQFFFFI